MRRPHRDNRPIPRRKEQVADAATISVIVAVLASVTIMVYDILMRVP